MSRDSSGAAVDSIVKQFEALPGPARQALFDRMGVVSAEHAMRELEAATDRQEQAWAIVATLYGFTDRLLRDMIPILAARDRRRGRKRPAEAVHAAWAALKARGLSHEKIARLWEKQSGQQVSRQAVSKALRRRAGGDGRNHNGGCPQP
jgi:hypothetical protein